MKVTGTKKLLIILFALTCALALGFGVVIARNASTGKGGVAYAEVTLPEATDAETSTEDGEEVSDAEEEKAEEEYDPRYDEGVIAEIAELTEIDAKFISFYCHVKEVDANELLTLISDAQEELRVNPGSENGYVINTPDGEQEGEIPDSGSEILSEIYNDIRLFASQYCNGEVSVTAEEETDDWFVSPDEASPYATYRYVGWNRSEFVNNNKYSYYRSTNGGKTWNNVTSSISFTTYFDSLPTPSYTNTGWSDSNGVWHNLWDHCGQRTVLELAPGEIFKINCVRTTSSPPYNIDGSHIANNPHWSEYLNFGWNAGTSYFVIDGDTPSGTEMLVYNSFPDLSSTANNGTYNGYLNFFTWANATAGWTSLNYTN